MNRTQGTKGKRVYLRLIEDADLERTYRWINDPEISEIMGYLPLSMAKQRRWLENAQDSEAKYIFAICLDEGDIHIGNVGLGNIDFVNRNAALSIFIYAPEHRAQGYGSEATRLAVEFAFNRLNLHKVHLKASDFSTEALQMYRNLGFVEEGRLRQHEFKRGRYVDKVLFGLLRDEFLLTHGHVKIEDD